MTDESASLLASPALRSTLVAVLDTLIPPHPHGLPGAGSLGVIDSVTESVAGLESVIAAALSALDSAALERGATSFETATAEDRRALIEEVASRHPGFLESLLFHSYAAYYQEPRVMEALGLEPRPPHPKGYELEMGDLGLLDVVRARGTKYRT